MKVLVNTFTNKVIYESQYIEVETRKDILVMTLDNDVEYKYDIIELKYLSIKFIKDDIDKTKMSYCYKTDTGNILEQFKTSNIETYNELSFTITNPIILNLSASVHFEKVELKFEGNKSLSRSFYLNFDKE